MPKKTKKTTKTTKIAILSDSDDDEDDFRKPTKKKGRKFAISDSDDEVEFSPKPSTSKGKIRICILSKSYHYFHPYFLIIAISRIFRKIFYVSYSQPISQCLEST